MLHLFAQALDEWFIEKRDIKHLPAPSLHRVLTEITEKFDLSSIEAFTREDNSNHEILTQYISQLTEDEREAFTTQLYRLQMREGEYDFKQLLKIICDVCYEFLNHPEAPPLYPHFATALDRWLTEKASMDEAHQDAYKKIVNFICQHFALTAKEEIFSTANYDKLASYVAKLADYNETKLLGKWQDASAAALGANYIPLVEILGEISQYYLTTHPEEGIC